MVAEPTQTDPEEPEAGGLGAPDPALQEGAAPDGSGDGGDDITLEDMGVDASGYEALSDEGKAIVDEIKHNVLSFLHEQRQTDSAKARELQEKADGFDRMASDPRVQAALDGRGPLPQTPAPGIPGEQAVPKEKFVSANELQSNFNSAQDLADYLNRRWEEALGNRLSKFKEETVDQMEVRERLRTVVSEMDYMYPKWRESIPAIKAAMTSNPGVDIRTAYERYVLLPSYKSRDSDRDALREHKRKLVSSQPRPTQVEGRKKDLLDPNVTEEEVILQVMGELESQGQQS